MSSFNRATLATPLVLLALFVLTFSFHSSCARADDLTGLPVDDPKDLQPAPSVQQPVSQSGSMFVAQTADSQTPFVIGILGQDPFGSALDDAVRGETVNGRPLVVKRFASAADLRPCQILFIDRSAVGGGQSRHRIAVAQRYLDSQQC